MPDKALVHMVDEWLDALRQGGFASEAVMTCVCDWLATDRRHLEAFVWVVAMNDVSRRSMRELLERLK